MGIFSLIRNYCSNEKGPWTRRVCVKSLVFMLAFAFVFNGVPLPLPVSAPEPLQAVKEALEVKEAEAAQIKRVQHGTSTYIPSDKTQDEALTYAVDVNNTMLLLSVESDPHVTAGGKGGIMYANGPSISFFTAVLESASSLTIARGAGNKDNIASGDQKVEFHVTEFLEGVNIYSGTTVYDKTDLIKNQTLSAQVFLNKALVLYNVNTVLHFDNENDALFYKLTLTPMSSPDQDKSEVIKIERQTFTTSQDNDPNAPISELKYYIIEFTTDTNVISGTGQIAATSASVTLTPSPVIADIDKAFLIFNYTPNNTADGLVENILVRGKINDPAGDLTFTRAAVGTAGDTIDIAWYVVEFLDDSSNVQRGSAALAGASTTAAISPAVDLARAFPLVTSSGGSGTFGLDDGFVRGNLTSGSLLTLDRTLGGQTGTANVEWQVVEFSPITVKTPNNGEVFSGGATETITWIHAESVAAHAVEFRLSRDSGTGFSTETLTCTEGARVAGDDICTWVVPDLIDGTNSLTTQGRIKIIDTALTANNFDTSNADFIIRGQLDLVSPDGPQDPVWLTGETHTVTWTHGGEIGSIKILYDTNSGLGADGNPNTGDEFPDPAQLIATVDGTLDTYAWVNIPVHVASVK